MKRMSTGEELAATVRKGTGHALGAPKNGYVGLVSAFIHGPTSAKDSARLTPGYIIQKMEAGLAVRELDDLRSSLDLSMDKLVSILGMSKATFHRRRTAGHLDAPESDRVVRFARLMGKAVEVLESEEAARQWLNAPQVGLGGAVPLQYARTEVGAREVENLLGRIEYGVYS